MKKIILALIATMLLIGMAPSAMAKDTSSYLSYTTATREMEEVIAGYIFDLEKTYGIHYEFTDEEFLLYRKYAIAYLDLRDIAFLQSAIALSDEPLSFYSSTDLTTKYLKEAIDDIYERHQDEEFSQDEAYWKIRDLIHTLLDAK